MAVSLRQSFHDTNAQLRVSHSVLGHAPSGSGSGEAESQQPPKATTSISGGTTAEKFNMATYNLGHSKESPRTKAITAPILSQIIEVNPPAPHVVVHDRIDEKTDEGEP